MTTTLITRHPGAIEWAARQGLQVDRQIAHLEPADIQPGDVVIGTLPVNLAAQVFERGGRFYNLTLDLPPEARGRELSADDLERYGARLEEYSIQMIANSSPNTSACLYRARNVFQKYFPPGSPSVADELIAERRAEAKREEQ
jgi:CRISPR-associated protein Csx16